MVGQDLLLGGILLQRFFRLLLPDFQCFQLFQGAAKPLPLLYGLGQQTGPVVAAAVFQLPQTLFQFGLVAAVVPG